MSCCSTYSIDFNNFCDGPDIVDLLNSATDYWNGVDIYAWDWTIEKSGNLWILKRGTNTDEWTADATVHTCPPDDWNDWSQTNTDPICTTTLVVVSTSGTGCPVSPTSYTLSGPTTGYQNAETTNFTVVLNENAISTVTITPSDGGSGGTFSPTSVSITSGNNSGTFTYTPSSSGNITISTSDDSSLTDPSSITFNAVSENAVDYKNAINTDSPYLYWKMDDLFGATRIYDWSGNSRHGDIIASPTLQSEAPFENSGESIYLNQGTTSNQYIRGGTYSDFPANQITLEMWVKLDSMTSPSQTALFNYGPSNDLILLYLNDRWSLFINGIRSNFNTTDINTIPINVWNHIVVQWETTNNEARLWVNSNLIETITLNTSSIYRTGYFIIGQEQDGSDGGFDSNQIIRGRVAHVSVFDSYLTQTQIENHYQTAVGNDLIKTFDFLIFQ